MTQIFAQNAVASRSLAYGSVTLPSFDNVLGEWWLGSGLTGFTNRITGVAATQVNAPPQSAGYVSTSFNGTTKKGLITDIKPVSNTATLIMLARLSLVSGGGGLVLMGLDDASAYGGMALVAPDTTHALAARNSLGVPANGRVTLPDALNFQFIAARITVSSPITPSRAFQTSTVGGVPATTYGDGDTSTSNPASLNYFFQMGSQNPNTYRGTADIAAAAIIDGDVGTTYLESVYPLWKNQATDLGLTVA